MSLLLGIDLGSSAIKAALVEAATGRVLAQARFPEEELVIDSVRPGWAEQDPEQWWAATVGAVRRVLGVSGVDARAVVAVGISYQMHGLVALDGRGKVVRPAIIWCDGRAVPYGQAAFEALGAGYCLGRLLNSPGNFTAAKLGWMAANEPALFKRTAAAMLPGDYLAFRMTGEMMTTGTGLSEGVLYDFLDNDLARPVIDFFGIPERMVPPRVPVFGLQGRLHGSAAAELGLPAGVPLTYRAGDQPNNALSLNALEPGEVAATAGTSGVVYGVTDIPSFDPRQRVNTFVHVNHRPEAPRYGVLWCLNGAGSQYRWLRITLGPDMTYGGMDRLAEGVPAGSEGLRVYPFGNGPERLFGNRIPGAGVSGLDVNRHGQAHLCRATLEGIAFAFGLGLGVFRELGLPTARIRAGSDNLFRSRVFAQTLADIAGCRIEVVDTSGAAGAAIGAGIGAGIYSSSKAAFEEGRQSINGVYEPENGDGLRAHFEEWSLGLRTEEQGGEL